MFSTTKVTILLLTSLLIFLAIELMVMYKDPTEFRARFKAYKEGKKPYENGLPAYAPGKSPYTDKQMARLRELDASLAAKGFDEYARAGLLGNAFHETAGTLDPNIKNKYGYVGLWQNSAAIQKAIIDQYKDHSEQSQLRYLDDWVSGPTWIRKGKHRDTTALYSGVFKKTGYKSAQEASEAFQKLYERAVIRDKDTGKVIGYQGWNDRNKHANQIYKLLYNKAPVQEQKSELVQQAEQRQWKPTIIQPKKEIPQDYPITVEAPESLNVYNNWSSPSYITRLPDIQQLPLEQFVPTVQPLKVQ